MADHSHCNSCFSASICNLTGGCSVEDCPKCETTLHSCKLEEHLAEICAESEVTCINLQYGCLETGIKRKDLIKHMPRCPVMTELLLPSALIQCEDCSTCINEYELLDHAKVCLEKQVPCLNVLFGCVQKMKRKELNHHLEHCPASLISCGYSYFRSQYNCNVHDGVRELRSQGYTPSSTVDEKFLLSDTEQHEDSPELSLTTHRNAYSLFERGEFGTCCYEKVRRDEFNNHWQSHLDFVDLLPEVVSRCPLFSYGCTYSIVHFQPSPPGHILDYNPDLQSFVILPPVPPSLYNHTHSTPYEMHIAKQRELVSYGYGDSIRGSLDVIGQLPLEVIFVILSYCDSQSLWALSQVNSFLRDVCWELVTNRGTVYQTWYREDGSDRWKQSTETWSFSKVIGYSGKMLIQTDTPAMGQHLMNCEVFKGLQDHAKYRKGSPAWNTDPQQFLSTREH